jgi:formate dehydrogenase iron-sulfur subunit
MAEPMGFFTDPTVCIGCKACEVACKQWNQLPALDDERRTLSGDSYDNTRKLDGTHWRHVKFVEQFDEDRRDGRWTMLSDVCKHCVQAGCLEVCPTGAIIRTEFDTVVIQSDTCNGCKACLAACPFGVIDINPVSNTAQKCTLCYDRLQAGMEPACSQGLPNRLDRVRPGARTEASARPPRRSAARGRRKRAALYGADDKMLGGLNAFFLLVDRPEVYGLPPDPKMPSRHLVPGAADDAGGARRRLVSLFNFRDRRAGEAHAPDGDRP